MSKALIIAVLVTVAGADASQLTLGQAVGYNVFTLSDFSGAGTDAEGRVAVGGNFAPSGGGSFTVASQLHDGAGVFDLVVGGSLTNSGTSFGSGSVVAGSNVNWSNISITNSLYANGSFTGTSSTLGSVDVTGSFSSNNANITNTAYVGGAYSGSSATLGNGIVAGAITLNSITSNNGNVYSQGTFSVGSGSVTNGTIYAGTYSGPGYLTHAAWTSAPSAPAIPAPVNFAAADTQLPGLSVALEGITQNGTVAATANSLTLTGTDANQNVFNLTAAQLSAALASGAAGITINAPSTSTVVINISGASETITSSQITVNGPAASQVIWNFDAASAISYSTVSWYGTILAPGAAFTGSGGNINGQLVANTVTGNTEFHDDLFTGTVNSAVPEPSSFLMFAGGCGLLAVALARRKRNRAIL